MAVTSGRDAVSRVQSKIGDPISKINTPRANGIDPSTLIAVADGCPCPLFADPCPSSCSLPLTPI
jgi:hypothetical protein